MHNPDLSLIIPCYNEESTLANIVGQCLEITKTGMHIEIIIVDDCSSDNSIAVAHALAKSFHQITVLQHDFNQGKGAALRTGFLHATGKYVGIQDADMEYNPMDYLDMMKPLEQGKADVVYGSRYLRQEKRRVLYFWHTWMNRSLTFLSNMFTNLDISDMETCYKLFRREVIQAIAPLLKENRFGFEPEVTALVAQHKYRVYECAIHYEPRSYEEGKKIGWKDGIRALFCILHYGAPYAPLPMQFFLYFVIGSLCALANLIVFVICMGQMPLYMATSIAFLFAAALNYLLCLAILFRHKARWTAPGELLAYCLTLAVMGTVDYAITAGLVDMGLSPAWSKAWSTLVGFIGNFLFRKYLVF